MRISGHNFLAMPLYFYTATPPPPPRNGYLRTWCYSIYQACQVTRIRPFSHARTHTTSNLTHSTELHQKLLSAGSLSRKQSGTRLFFLIPKLAVTELCVKVVWLSPCASSSGSAVVTGYVYNWVWLHSTAWARMKRTSRATTSSSHIFPMKTKSTRVLVCQVLRNYI